MEIWRLAIHTSTGVLVYNLDRNGLQNHRQICLVLNVAVSPPRYMDCLAICQVLTGLWQSNGINVIVEKNWVPEEQQSDIVIECGAIKALVLDNFANAATITAAGTSGRSNTDTNGALLSSLDTMGCCQNCVTADDRTAAEMSVFWNV